MCKFAINVGIIINPTAYLFFFVSKNLSIKYIVNTNNINVTNCALAAIYPLIKYITPIVIIKEID